MAHPLIRSFGPFELDSRSGELRKHGLRVRLADQPRTVLELLLEHPGELVTREQIRERLWPADTFVDFEGGLSSVIRKLRDALGDSAEHPRFIETLPRRGYRFIAPVTPSPVTAPAEVVSAASVPGVVRGGRPGWTRLVWIAAFVAVLGAAALLARSASRPRVNPDANDAFLKGVAAMGREDVSGFRAAVAYFDEATRKQPDFAMAYARMGYAQLQLVYAGQFAPREIVPRADAAVRRALALDASIALAHRTRAMILHDYYWQWAESEREVRRSLELDPASIDARVELAFEALRAGRIEEAIAEAQRARTLDPPSRLAALTFAAVLRTAGQTDRALAEYRALLERDPRIARGHFQLGVTYAAMERWPEAVHALRRAVDLTPENTRFLSYLGFALVRAGQLDAARGVLDDLRARSTRQYVSSFGIALIHEALGERESALAALARAYDDHALEFSQWRQYPGFELVRAEPRYQAVLRNMTRLP